MDGDFQRHNSRLDYNISGLHHSSNCDDSCGWRQYVADYLWSYFALFLGMTILAIFFLIDERLGE